MCIPGYNHNRTLAKIPFPYIKTRANTCTFSSCSLFKYSVVVCAKPSAVEILLSLKKAQKRSQWMITRLIIHIPRLSRQALYDFPCIVYVRPRTLFIKTETLWPLRIHECSLVSAMQQPHTWSFYTLEISFMYAYSRLERHGNAMFHAGKSSWALVVSLEGECVAWFWVDTWYLFEMSESPVNGKCGTTSRRNHLQAGEKRTTTKRETSMVLEAMKTEIKGAKKKWQRDLYEKLKTKDWRSVGFKTFYILIW